jgi:very-short-patch-repair endonuclease
MRRNPHHATALDHKRARKLRQESSRYEQKLWFALRQATGGTKLKFRRQQPIHPYIADFACMEAKLLVELDGMSHDTRLVYDRTRDAYLKRQAYVVLRILNEDVGTNLAGAVEAIIMEAEKLLKQTKAKHPLSCENLRLLPLRGRQVFASSPQGGRKPLPSPFFHG